MANSTLKLRSIAIPLLLVTGIAILAEDAHAIDITSPLFPENKWVKLDAVPVAGADWFYRQVHAGAVFDSKRKMLLIFGSDTHSAKNAPGTLVMDNTVHEFNPSTKTWKIHYPSSALSTYQKDAYGQAIANAPENPRPWAMHTFDDLAYDPTNDNLVSVGSDGHNYGAYAQVPGARNPTWLYSPASRTWATFINYGASGGSDHRTVPQFFATAAEYDPDRDIIWAGNSNDPPGLWYIDAARNAWVSVTPAATRPKAGFNIQYSMVYDTLRHKLALFGTYNPKSSKVAFYTPGSPASSAGTWEIKTPGGDIIPAFNQVPVAYDSEQGVFLLLPKNSTADTARKTYVYDADKNIYVHVPNADDVPSYNGELFNYTLVYDSSRKAFLFVSGNYNTPLQVWVFKLNYARLQG